MVLSIVCVAEVQVSSDESDCLMVSNGDCAGAAEIGADLDAGGAILGGRRQEQLILGEEVIVTLPISEVDYGRQGEGTSKIKYQSIVEGLLCIELSLSHEKRE